MHLQEHVSLKKKTTMRMGGTARCYADIGSKEDLEEAVQFAGDQNLPLIVLGGGSNTVFADGEIEALVIRITANTVGIDDDLVTAEAGTILAVLINQCAELGLDLSALTGIPGSLGGAIFGNAGQGPAGIWIDSFVQEVEVYEDGEWNVLGREECAFRYRESGFKDHANRSSLTANSYPIIWSVKLKIPKGNPDDIKSERARLLQKRIDTQPHLKTAGSCFKGTDDGTPAWKLIDAAGLRGTRYGGVEISEKHANFLLNVEDGSMDDLLTAVAKVRKEIPQIPPIEMRLFGKDGGLVT